jgi:hypothetical protein
MLENEEKDVQYLKDYLRKKGLQISEEEIEKYAHQLYMLGKFVVHLKVIESSSPQKEDSE